MFIGIIGFLAFGVGIIWLIASFFTKKGFKKPLITIGVGFVLFIVGVVMDPTTEEQTEGSTVKSSEVIKDTSEEDSEAEAKQELDEKDKQEKAEVIAKKEKEEAEAKVKKEQEEKEKAEAESVKKDEEEKAKATSESIAAEESKKESEVPREHKNALNNAYDYLDYTSFSKNKLYDQLIYEGYPDDAAQYAIDNVKTDWNKNALQAAIDYLDYTSFSDQGLYDQLIYEEFTSEQAQYAMDNLP
ncbi:Ltp family lipoprotein [Carnobacterium sp.]|uniref:Ltp family lipoprotein n=1 Tax=Carnobacterium sp. TaxID=48221 RepID=UPI003C71531D